MNISIRLFLIYIVFHINVNAQNVLLNPGFDSDENKWELWGGQIQGNNAKIGRNALYIYNPDGSPKWSGAHQDVLLQPTTSKVIVGGWMKTSNVVQGSNPWELARISVEFLDANNQLVGGYPPVVAQYSGTNEWKYNSFEYNVPTGAKSIKVQLALANCTGEAWFDECSVLLFDPSGKIQTASTFKGITDYGIWVPMPIDSKLYTGNFIDWSHLLDAPAGKHGFLKASSNGDLLFEDQTKIRFLGVNLVATTCFPETHALADSLVLRLAKLGCNIVRLHHMDAPWSVPNIFGSKTSSQKLDPIQLEKVDYLISALKKKGIYVFLDFLVHREFYTNDGVPSNLPDLGGKQVGYFDSIVIVKQQEYIKQWMTHFNPYTKVAYKDEPAIVASEFINESTMFTHFGGDILNPYYRNEINAQFNKQYKNEVLTIFDLNYEAYANPILKVRNEGSNVNHSISFLNSIEQKYYAKMYAFSRQIGIKYLLSGSNMPMPLLSYQYNNKAMELMLTNEYWDHPQVWRINNDWNRVEYAPIHNQSAIKQYNKSSVFAISKYQWSNKPLIVTEYNACYPNEYMLEALPMTLAYSNLHQVNGIIQFAFDNKQIGKDPLRSFDVSTNPNHLANWAVCVPMFQYNYVNKAVNVAYDHIDTSECYQLPNYSDYIDKEAYLPYVTRLEKSTNHEETPHGTYSKFHNVTTGEINSDTKELRLNYIKGEFSIHTPKMQGATGQLNDKTNEFESFKFTTKNPWVGVFLISSTNQTLVDSKELILMVNTPTKLTGQTYNTAHTALEKMGNYPFLMQQFEGNVSIKTNKNVEVVAYSIQGNVMGSKLLTVDEKGYVTFDPAMFNTMIFKIIKK